MNQALVDRVVHAVLYEGYLLYPYRPSVKNRQRWTFGGVYPRAFSLAQGGSDAWTMQTECLAAGGPSTAVTVTVRFLHLVARQVGELAEPLAEWAEEREPPFRSVESLRVGGRLWQTWQEAEERTVTCPPADLEALTVRPGEERFAYPGRRTLEPLRGATGEVVAVLVREQQPLAGTVALSAEPAGAGLFKVRVRIQNDSPLEGVGAASRDAALLRTLVSTHTILEVRGGEFVSLLDPPEACRAAAAGCRNEGTWPVLVGAAGDRDTLLSSPIILYDYPEVAAESPGDLFDATEIDEILTLRILTLTAAEREAALAVDERALLQRTEALAAEQFLGLHGTVRGWRALPAEDDHE